MNATGKPNLTVATTAGHMTPQTQLSRARALDPAVPEALMLCRPSHVYLQRLRPMTRAPWRHLLPLLPRFAFLDATESESAVTLFSFTKIHWCQRASLSPHVACIPISLLLYGPQKERGIPFNCYFLLFYKTKPAAKHLGLYLILYDESCHGITEQGLENTVLSVSVTEKLASSMVTT